MLQSPRSRSCTLSGIAAKGGWCAVAALIAIAGACVDHPTPHERRGKRAMNPGDAGALAADGGGGPLCPEGVYDDSVYVETERDLQALRGCKRITGNLTVSSESLSNLLGLEALATVEGTLQIGPTWSGETVGADTQFDRFKSLAGLENLRAVGALQLTSLGLTSLEPVASRSCTWMASKISWDSNECAGRARASCRTLDSELSRGCVFPKPRACSN
jgi:hypothetical protein